MTNPPIKNRDLTDAAARTEVFLQDSAIEPLFFTDKEITALLGEEEVSLLDGKGLAGNIRIHGKVRTCEGCE